MKEPERPNLGLPKGERDRRSLAISVILHVIFGIAVSSVAIVPILNIARGARDIRPERVTYIQTAETTTTPPVRDTIRRQPPREERRDDPPREPPVAATPPVAGPPVTTVPPTEIPVGVNPPRGVNVGGGGDSLDRRIVGRGGLRGLTPGSKDPRLSGAGDTRRPDGPNTPERLPTDSIAGLWVRAYWDSVSRSQSLTPGGPPSWTVGSGDKKFGIDPAYVYFGKFKLPTALLALIPIKTQGNLSIAERSRAIASMHREIEFQALRADNSKDFHDAVKELRARKEAEYQARRKKNE